MPIVQLSESLAKKAARPTMGRYLELFDEIDRGFFLRVTANGRKSWNVSYRFDGERRTIKLGDFPSLCANEARKVARQFRNKAQIGIDPSPVRQRRINFSQAIELYYERKLRQNKTAEKSLRWLRIAEKTLGSQPLDRITRSDIADVIYTHSAPASANAILQMLRALFGWLVDTGKLEQSPCERMKPPHKSKSRARVLSQDELKAVWGACDRIGYPFGPLVQLLILTGQRRSEIASLRWTPDPLGKHGHIEGDWLKFPDTKNGKAHEVPLSPLALQIIKAIPRRGEYLFNRGKPFDSFVLAKRKLDHESGVTAWVLHDLRRTVRTGLARLRVPMEVAERILNHSPAIAGGLVGTYDQHDYRQEMREALKLWESACSSRTSQPKEINLN